MSLKMQNELVGNKSHFRYFLSFIPKFWLVSNLKKRFYDLLIEIYFRCAEYATTGVCIHIYLYQDKFKDSGIVGCGGKLLD